MCSLDRKVISGVRNLSCVCCDSAIIVIMSGKGGRLRQGERERQGLF